MTSTPLTVDAFFAVMTNLTAALTRVADNQDRLLAGQQAALDKIETKAPSTRGKGKGAAAEPETQAPEAGPESEKGRFPQHTVTDADGLKTFATGWIGEADGDEKQARVRFLNETCAHLNVAPKFPEIAANAEALKKLVFLIARRQAGQAVDLAAGYDFDGDPAQEVAESSDFG